MTGFEPGSYGIGNDHSANCATTTAQFSAGFSFDFLDPRFTECVLKVVANMVRFARLR